MLLCCSEAEADVYLEGNNDFCNEFPSTRFVRGDNVTLEIFEILAQDAVGVSLVFRPQLPGTGLCVVPGAGPGACDITGVGELHTSLGAIRTLSTFFCV